MAERTRRAVVDSLEQRILFTVLPNGIDTQAMGKGDWIWQVNSVRANVGASDVQGVVDYMAAKGMQWVIVKAGDGNDGPSGSYSQFNTDLINRFHLKGIKVFGYHFIYGGGDPSPKVATTTPEGELDVQDQIMDLNPDGLIIDAEGTYETAPNKQDTALAYGELFKDSHPDKLLGHAPFPYVSLHSAFPYYEFGKYSDVVMPQAYWKTIGIAQTPEVMVEDLDDEWSALYDSWRGTSKADAIKPIVPIGQGYDPSVMNPLPAAEITRFYDLLNSDPDSPSPGGYGGVSFWSAQHHTAAQWTAIGNGTVGPRRGIAVGTSASDVIRVTGSGTNVTIVVNSEAAQTVSNFDEVLIVGNSGNDLIYVEPGISIPVIAYGNSGKDTIVGGTGNDSLFGNGGHDRLIGGDGDDYLVGGGNTDILAGQNGNDALSGNGGKDALYDGFGLDRVLGGASNDVFFAEQDHLEDYFNGNSGNDTVLDPEDLIDELNSIEHISRRL